MSKKVFSIFSLLLAMVMIVSVTQPAFSSNEGKMRVWVEFSPGNAARVEKSLKGMGAEFHYRFEELNSFVVTVPEQALAGLRNNPNVVSIEEDAIRYPAGDTVPYGIDMVQARDVWDADRDGVVDLGAPTGSNRTVCIIDSGIYKQHEDLSGVTFLGGYPTGWDTDKCGHGTHVAGTITASFNNGVGVVGVNPGTTNLYIVKVFGDDCGWTYSSTLADAANRCGTAGADVISMSLGGTQKSKLEERAFNTLYTNGVLSIAAAGNDGNTAISYPGGYASVVSVAAIDEDMVVADFSQKNSTVELAAPGVGVLSTVPLLKMAELIVEGVNYNANQVEFSAEGTTIGSLINGGLCDSSGDWSGNVVLCERGEISFLDKVMNVQNSGGHAAIIYNNVPGGFFGTLGEGFSSDIPAISISQEDGQYLINNQLSKLATVNIYTLSEPISGYEAWDGTSMATPHVSGVAALIWSADPTWTNEQIRKALTSTAYDLGAVGRDVEYGYGLVQAAEALAYLGGGDPPPPPPSEDKIMNLIVSPDKTTVSNNQTVNITVTATDIDGPVGGANVIVTIKNSTKTLASFNGPTNSSGVVTFSYRVKTRTTGTGIMSVLATSTKDGYQTATATTSFKVE